MKITREFIEKIPKTDLHLHLDGSLRLSTLIELARENNIHLPAYTEKELKQKVFKDRYDSLEDYLEGFKYTSAVLQGESPLERVAYELAVDNSQFTRTFANSLNWLWIILKKGYGISK